MSTITQEFENLKVCAWILRLLINARLWNCCCATVTCTEKSQALRSAVHREMEGPLGAQLQQLCLEPGEICRGWGRQRSWWRWGCSIQLLQQGDSTGFCPSKHWWHTKTDKALYSLGLTFMRQRHSFNNYLGGSVCTQGSGFEPTTSVLPRHSLSRTMFRGALRTVLLEI